jgi:hypothetical protein
MSRGFEDMPRRVPDLSRVAGLIGYAPTLSLDDILNQVIDYFRKKMKCKMRNSSAFDILYSAFCILWQAYTG